MGTNTSLPPTPLSSISGTGPSVQLDPQRRDHGIDPIGNVSEGQLPAAFYLSRPADEAGA